MSEDDKEVDINMEDDDARDRSQKDNKHQDDSERAPDQNQGESVPAGANDATDDQAGVGTTGTPGEGSGVRGGSQGEGGGASQGGGTGNP